MSIESVTRACYARALSPEAWEGLLAQLPASDDETELCAVLLRIINAASFAPPTALSYLRHSCRSVNPAVRISASYLAKRTIEFATPESTNSLDSPFDAVLAVVNEFISPGPSVGATAAENALEELVVVLGLLKIFLVLPPHSILSPTQIYTQRQLAVLLPLVHVRSMDAEAIATLSTLLNDLLPSLLAQAASSTSPFYQQTRDALQTLSNRFQSSPVKVSTPRINLDEESFGPTPDLTVATFLINDLMRRTTSNIGSGSTFAVARLYSALKLRITDAASSDTPVERVVVAFFLEILLASTSGLRNGVTDLMGASFAYSRLPELVREVFVKLQGESEDPGLTAKAIMETTFQHFKSATISIDAMDDASSPSSAVLNSLLAGFCRERVLDSNFVLSLDEDIHPDDLVRHEVDFISSNFSHIESVLNTILHDHTTHSPIASSLVTLLQTWSSRRDLASLARLSKILIDKPEFLDVLFLHIEPSGVLVPVREFLEGFVIEGEGFGEPHPLEEFGSLVLFVQIVVARYDLSNDLTRHLGTDRGFFRQWLPSVCVNYPLQSMDEESLSTVRGWIAALFGEGISDELIQSTNPRTLLRVASTICQQAIVAAQMGVIENLKESLGYFLQGLLSFTLPGVLKWLIGEVARSSASTMQTILVEILELFLGSDLLPSSVLELVAPDLRSLLASSNIGLSTSIDISKMRKLIAPFVESKLTPSTNPEERFLQDLNNSLESPSSSIDLQSSFSVFCQTHEPHQVVIKLLQSLLYSEPKIDSTEHAKQTIRARRLGIALLTSSFDLVGVLLEEILPSILAAYRGIAKEEIAKEEIDERWVRSAEVLAGIVGGCLVGLYHAGERREGERMIRSLRRILGGKGNGSESAFDLFSSHIASHLELLRIYPTIIATKP